MDLQQLRAIGALKNRSIVKKTITATHFPRLPEDQWKDPNVPEFGPDKVADTMDVYIRPRSSADTMEIAVTERRLVGHLLILRCVVDQNAVPIFPSIDEVLELEEWLFLPLYNAVSEVNQIGPKHLPPRTSSGATSRSRSGVVRSRNGRKPSATANSSPGSNTPASAERSTPSAGSTATSPKSPGSSATPPG